MCKHPRGSRCILSSEQVLDIFRFRMQRSGAEKCKTSASAVAKTFGISPKTVRDIWKGRTWYRTTHQLEPNRADAPKRLNKHAGRPRGVKDSKPRVRKVTPSEIDTAIMTVCSEQSLVDDGSSAMARYETVWGGVHRIAQFTSDISHIHDSTTCQVCASSKRLGTKQTFQPTFDFDSFHASFIDPFHDDWQEWLGTLRKRDREKEGKPNFDPTEQ